MEIKYSLKSIFIKNKGKISITFLLVILELISNLLLPLFIGYAINDLLTKKYDGLIILGILMVFSIVIGSLRRFYDSRAYSKVYKSIATQLVEDEQKKCNDISKISARISLLNELVEFFENSFPEIMNSFLGLIGVFIIISTINLEISLLCLLIILVIFVVYGVTSKKNLQLNKDYNDELETLVARLETKDKENINGYFERLMRVNVKLSDLETINFSIVTMVSMGIFTFSILIITLESNVAYGTVFSILMYAYEFIERIIVLPLYYQNYIRLKEISFRLSTE